MFSEKGLIARLLELNKTIQQIHCIAHRLSLAAVDAAKDCTPVQKFKEIVVELCK